MTLYRWGMDIFWNHTFYQTFDYFETAFIRQTLNPITVNQKQVYFTDISSKLKVTFILDETCNN